jgi:hypothetical protein
MKNTQIMAQAIYELDLLDWYLVLKIFNFQVLLPILYKIL